MKSRLGAAADVEANPGARASARSPVDAALATPSIALATAAPGHAAQWRTAWVAYGLCFVAALVLFRDTVASLVAIYLGNATFNHGFLILPIVGYMIWVRRAALARLRVRPTAWAIGPLLVAGFGWLAGQAADVDMVEHFALLGVLWSLFLGIFGWRVVRELAFPLFYAVFAVPFGDFLVPPLQDLTAIMAVKGIELVNIPVYSDGLLISIPPGNFEVAEACAGLRFLIATIALGFLFSYLTYRSLLRRAIFLLLCVIVPIFANGIRAWGIVFIGYKSNMQAAVGFDHIIYGWLFFAIITAILLALGMTFRDQPIGELPVSRAAPDPGLPASRIYIGAIAAGMIVLAAAAPVYASLVINRAPPAGPIMLTAPQVGNGWRLLDEYRDSWRPVFSGADATLLRSYVKSGRTVHFFVAYYRSQSGGHEVVNYGNRVYDDKTWIRVGAGSDVAVIEGEPVAIEYTRLVQGRSGRMVWSWNWVADVYTANPYRSKLLEARAKLFGGRRAAAQISIAADYNEKPAEAAEVLKDFLSGTPSLRPLLVRAAGG